MRGASRSATLPLYLGGFIGPFGGGMLNVLVPQLRDAFGATSAEVALAIPAYLIPFAALQLVSGTMGERLGRRRVVRAGYVFYGLFSFAAAAAPGIGAFIVFRALQGAANAFLTPLLLAGLADLVDARRLGRSVGTFAAVQTAAVAVAPLSGGLLAGIDWRLAFVVPGLVSASLAFFAPADPVRAADHEPARLRAVMTRRMALLCGAAFAGFASLAGLGFIVALRIEDAFGLGAGLRGLVLAGFGVAGMLTGRASGGLVDRFGRVPVVLVGVALCAPLVALIGVAGSAVLTAALWFAVGAASSLVWAGLNTLVIEAVPGNRGGATSVFGTFRFAGNAAAPLMFLPLYDAHAWLAFAGAGALAATVAAFTAPLRAG